MKALLIAVLFCVPAAAEDVVEAPREQGGRALGVGVNYLGGQLDYDFGRGKRLEVRYLQGRQNSDEGKVRTSVAGARLIQRFRMQGVYHPYLGYEADYVDAKVAGGAYKVGGAALGPFIGVERSLGGRLSAGVDVGPYVFILKEHTTHAGGAQFDVVANAFLLFRVY